MSAVLYPQLLFPVIYTLPELSAAIPAALSVPGPTNFLAQSSCTWVKEINGKRDKQTGINLFMAVWFRRTPFNLNRRQQEKRENVSIVDFDMALGAGKR